VYKKSVTGSASAVAGTSQKIAPSGKLSIIGKSEFCCRGGAWQWYRADDHFQPRAPAAAAPWWNLGAV